MKLKTQIGPATHGYLNVKVVAVQRFSFGKEKLLAP